MKKDIAEPRHEKSIKSEPNSVAAETVQTASIPAVDLPRVSRPLEVGARVWIYDGQAPPREGTITASGDRIIAGTWYARDTYGERLYSRHVLYTDPENLIAEVQNSVYLLERWEREFRTNS